MKQVAQRVNVQTKPEMKQWCIHKGKAPIRLHYTLHALDRIDFRQLKVEEFIYVKSGEIVEAEYFKAQLLKLVVRKKLNTFEDICYVLVPLDMQLHNFKAVTIYINRSSDKHETLDTSRLGRIQCIA